jgi:hypothetical protein
MSRHRPLAQPPLSVLTTTGLAISGKWAHSLEEIGGISRELMEAVASDREVTDGTVRRGWRRTGGGGRWLQGAWRPSASKGAGGAKPKLSISEPRELGAVLAGPAARSAAGRTRHPGGRE